jgi:hypothetical protein
VEAPTLLGRVLDFFKHQCADKARPQKHPSLAVTLQRPTKTPTTGGP